jgi:hypothetical protein
MTAMLGTSKNSQAEGLEKIVSEWMSQLGDRIGADRMVDVVTGAMAGVARTRRSVDRNVSALMSMANIPSRGEYERVHARLNAVQNSIRNLSRRLDDLNRQIEGGQKTQGARKAPARKRKAKAGSAKSAKPKTANSKTGKSNSAKSRFSKSKAGKTTRSASGASAKTAKPKARVKPKAKAKTKSKRR